MRISLSHIVILALLFSSLEGVTDVVVDGMPHGDDVAHQSEFGHALEDHDGSVPDSELDGEHCKHCCHSHSSTISALVVTSIAPVKTGDRRSNPKSYILNFSQAPPTPPPNA